MGNVRRAVRAMVTEAHSPGDHVAFVDSSHGNGDGRGNSYLCLLKEHVTGQTVDEREGQYWDQDLASDLSYYGYNRASAFVFLDTCPCDGGGSASGRGMRPFQWWDPRGACGRPAVFLWHVDVFPERLRTGLSLAHYRCAGAPGPATTSPSASMGRGRRRSSTRGCCGPPRPTL